MSQKKYSAGSFTIQLNIILSSIPSSGMNNRRLAGSMRPSFAFIVLVMELNKRDITVYLSN